MGYYIHLEHISIIEVYCTIKIWFRLQDSEPLSPCQIPGVAFGDEVWLGQGAKVGIDETSFSGKLTQVSLV